MFGFWGRGARDRDGNQQGRFRVAVRPRRWRRSAIPQVGLGAFLVATAVTFSALPAGAVDPLCQTITGTVFDAYGVPLAGAQVIWSSNNCGSGTGTTDAAGRYSAQLYPTSFVNVTVTKTGYAPQMRALTYSALPGTANDFTLLYSLTASTSPAYVRPGGSVTITAQTGAPPVQPGGPWLCSWGDNQIGQLGTGAMGGTRASPGVVVGSGGAGTLLSGVRSVVSSYVFSLALMNDGTVMAWGQNAYGELGDRQASSSATPVLVKGIGGVGTLSGVTAIAAGDHHALAVLSDGTVVAWGNNDHGQLGNAWASVYPRYPVQVASETGAGALSGVVQVAAGSAHSLALKSDGTAWGWGNGTYNGTSNTNNIVTYPGQVLGVYFNYLTNVTAIAAHSNHSMALRSDGSVVGWGTNSSGEVGDGTTTFQQWPRQVVDSSGSALTGMDMIAAGDGHSLARRSDGTLFAWGNNNSGQLGTTSGSSSSANPVVRSDTSAPLKVTSIAAGGLHSVAALPDGSVMTWGDNTDGQLGRGGAAKSVLRAQAPGGVGYLAGSNVVAAGLQHTLALRDRPCDIAQGVTRVQVVAPDGSVTQLANSSTNSQGITTWTGSIASAATASDGPYWPRICVVDGVFNGTCDTTLGAPAIVAPQLVGRYDVDSTPPHVYTTTPAPYSDTMTRGAIAVSWADYGAGVDPASITMTVDGQQVTPMIGGSTASIDGSRLSSGVHEVTSTASDRLGNGPATYSFLFTYSTMSAGAATATLKGTTPASVNPSDLPIGPSTVTFHNVSVDVSAFSETMNASTWAGKGSISRPFTLGTATVRFSNATGQTEDDPVTITTRSDPHNIAVLAPSTAPLSFYVPKHTTVIGDVTANVPTAYQVGHTGATATLLGGTTAALGDDLPDAGQLISTILSGQVPVVGSIKACFSGRGTTALAECQADESATAYIPAAQANGAPAYSIGVPTDSRSDATTTDYNNPLCQGACAQQSELRRMLMGVAFQCPAVSIPSRSTPVDLCTDVATIPGAPTASAWSLNSNVWVYEQTGGAGYPVWQQDHAQPGAMECPNGRAGSVTGSTYRFVANTTDLDANGRSATASGTGPDASNPAPGDEYVYLGSQTGNSMAGLSPKSLGFQLSNDPSPTYNGANAPLTISASGYAGPVLGSNTTGDGTSVQSTDASGNQIPAATANSWQAGTSSIAAGPGTSNSVQLFSGTVYDTGWATGDSPAHYALSAGTDFQLVLDYSTCR